MLHKNVLSIFQSAQDSNDYHDDDDDDASVVEESCELNKSIEKNGVFKPYGKKIFVNRCVLSNFIKMNWIIVVLFIFGSIGTIPSTVAETDYFPGLRRKPPILQNWFSEENESLLLAQISSIIEEQARRRFQQQMQQQQQQLNDRGILPKDGTLPSANTEFSFEMPVRQLDNPDADIPFAISPADPRYYNQIPVKSKVTTDKQSLTAEEYEDTSFKDNEISMQASSDGVPYFKLKAPMNVNPKFMDYPSRNVLSREEITGMIEKLSEHNGLTKLKQHAIRGDVVQKPMDIDSVMGMYVVALVAGISAAITVGLISLGIAWYTLHKKAKAAADVEYPAYGVTGPNKDISPSGDRRLAQSAQMYHYQHQKQQIIAMENRSNNGDRKGSLSDVESDDENEEGDYTVYECPGLAPTGEMEVKNPLFLDDPTPATPANLIQHQQPSKQGGGMPNSPSNTTPSTPSVNLKKGEEGSSCEKKGNK